MGHGYFIKVLFINAKSNPKIVSLELYRVGTKLDEQIIFEGKTYNYNKGFFKTIDSIFDNEITLKKYILSNMELNYLLILAESDMSVGISTTFAG